MSCKEKFKTARYLAYNNNDRSSAIDSALRIVNESLEVCDSLRKELVDFKIVLFLATKRYEQGIAFVDSLNANDFTYPYKQSFTSKSLKALKFEKNNDTLNRNIIYREMVNDLEVYAAEKKLTDKEHQELYTELLAVAEKYLSVEQLDKKIDSLIIKYPEKSSFFEFFKKR